MSRNDKLTRSEKRAVERDNRVVNDALRKHGPGLEALAEAVARGQRKGKR